jgi:hypothetical protein
MSSMAALVLLAASAPPAAGISAEQAMANYRALLRGSPDVATQADCPAGHGDGIVVCGQRKRQQPRLPLPDERGEPGDAVHHLGEPPAAMAPGPPGSPSRLMQTLGKGLGLLKSAITGEDPN